MSTGRTKIIATAGPSIMGVKAFADAIMAGADAFRLNFSHGTRQSHIITAREIREASLLTGKEAGILADLQGPKIRVGLFKGGKAKLKEGERFDLVVGLELGDERQVGLEWPEIARETQAGDILVLDDGKLRLRVDMTDGNTIQCEVLNSATLSNRKGVNKLGGGLSAKALTQKDRSDILLAAEIGADILALSFVKDEFDIDEARDLCRQAGLDCMICAKIERAEAMKNLSSILLKSDGAMVARGDLALEVGEAKVPFMQKEIIKMARELGRFSITATQMLESMITAPAPTRAEVSDIANATLDGTDALMLSAETASGAHALKALAAMRSISNEACDQHDAFRRQRREQPKDMLGISQAVAFAAADAANIIHAKAIVCLTESGRSAVFVSRALPDIPIIGGGSSASACRRMSILRGVTPILFPHISGKTFLEAWPEFAKNLAELSFLKKGELVIVTHGEPMGTSGATDTMRVMRMP